MGANFGWSGSSLHLQYPGNKHACVFNQCWVYFMNVHLQATDATKRYRLEAVGVDGRSFEAKLKFPGQYCELGPWSPIQCGFPHTAVTVGHNMELSFTQCILH